MSVLEKTVLVPVPDVVLGSGHTHSQIASPHLHAGPSTDPPALHSPLPHLHRHVAKHLHVQQAKPYSI